MGLRVGSFLVDPRLVVGERFDDNIFAVEDSRDADFITTVTPGVTIRSDWNNHALNFEANGTFGRYLSETSENYEDVRVGIGGRLDITRTIQTGGGAVEPVEIGNKEIA